MIQRLVPNASWNWLDKWKEELEELMLNEEFDVLVATTIIESGLDVPNNTILSITIILVCLICIKCDVWAKKSFCYLSAVFNT
jgi:late competence protein required for DNA uptake (superfamily II DNA/RNA helicase)